MGLLHSAVQQSMQSLVEGYIGKLETSRMVCSNLEAREAKIAEREAELAKREADLADHEVFIAARWTAQRNALRKKEADLRQREAAVVELRGLRSSSMYVDESAAEQLSLERSTLGATAVRLNTKIRHFEAQERERYKEQSKLRYENSLSFLPPVRICHNISLRPPLLLLAPKTTKKAFSIPEALSVYSKGDTTEYPLELLPPAGGEGCSCFSYPLGVLLEAHLRKHDLTGAFKVGCKVHRTELGGEAEEGEREPSSSCLRVEGMPFSVAEMQYLLQGSGGVLAVVEQPAPEERTPSPRAMYVWARSAFEGNAMREALLSTDHSHPITAVPVDPSEIPDVTACKTPIESHNHISAVLICGLIPPPYEGSVTAKEINVLLSLAGRVKEVYTFYPTGGEVAEESDRFTSVVTYDTFSECLQAEEIFDERVCRETADGTPLVWRVTPCSVPLDLSIHTGHYNSSEAGSWDLTCSAPVSNSLAFTFSEPFILKGYSNYQGYWAANTNDNTKRYPKTVDIILGALTEELGEEGFWWKWCTDKNDVETKDGCPYYAVRKAVCVCRDRPAAVRGLLTTKSALGRSNGVVCPVAFFSHSQSPHALPLPTKRPIHQRTQQDPQNLIHDFSGVVVIDIHSAHGQTSHPFVVFATGWSNRDVIGKKALGSATHHNPNGSPDLTGTFCTVAQQGQFCFNDGADITVSVENVNLSLPSYQACTTLLGYFTKQEKGNTVRGVCSVQFTAFFQNGTPCGNDGALLSVDPIKRAASEDQTITELLTVSYTRAAMHRDEAVDQQTDTTNGKDSRERPVVPKWEADGTKGDSDRSNPQFSLSSEESLSDTSGISFKEDAVDEGMRLHRNNMGIPLIDPNDLTGVWHLTLHFEGNDGAEVEDSDGLMIEQAFLQPVVTKNFPIFLYLNTTQVLDWYQTDGGAPSSSLVAKIEGRIRNSGEKNVNHVYGEVHCYADIVDDPVGNDPSAQHDADSYNFGYFLRLLVWHVGDCTGGIPLKQNPLFSLTAIIDPDEPVNLLSGKVRRYQDGVHDGRNSSFEGLAGDANPVGGSLSAALFSVFNEMESEAEGKLHDVDCLLEKMEFVTARQRRANGARSREVAPTPDCMDFDATSSSDETSIGIGPFDSCLCDPSNLTSYPTGENAPEVSRTKATPLPEALKAEVNALLGQMNATDETKAKKKKKKRKKKKGAAQVDEKVDEERCSTPEAVEEVESQKEEEKKEKEKPTEMQPEEKVVTRRTPASTATTASSAAASPHPSSSQLCWSTALCCSPMEDIAYGFVDLVESKNAFATEGSCVNHRGVPLKPLL